MKERIILHSDLNNFYASVECRKNPQWQNLPLVVCGDPSARHGIVLAKNMIAKKSNITTGMLLSDARQKEPNLVAVVADFESYIKASNEVRKIYERFTDFIEPFGIDEAWLDVTNSQIFGNGETIANSIREMIKNELKLTASIGVSYNKIFAKFGSDYKKPDATTLITKNNYKEIVWPQSAKNLLYIGKATEKKLQNIGIETVGQLANASITLLTEKLGKWGQYLNDFANGLDTSPVKKMNQNSIIKSVGNSLTAPYDLNKIDEIHALLIILAESVANRIYKHDLGYPSTLQLWVRDIYLNAKSFQCKFAHPSNTSLAFTNTALNLFKKNYNFMIPVRSLGINVSNFKNDFIQQSFWDNETIKQFKIDRVQSRIRRKHGHDKIFKAQVMLANKMIDIDIEADHTIHPFSFFR